MFTQEDYWTIQELRGHGGYQKGIATRPVVRPRKGGVRRSGAVRRRAAGCI